MAISKILIASFLLSAFVLLVVQAEPPKASAPVQSPAPSGVIACVIRCSKNSRTNLCERACGSCCKRCKCVPPGTYGNYDVCPCYASLTTRGGRPKCP
ncbi:Gibberellin-regulated protein 3 [Bienertia sinuspersici]